MRRYEQIVGIANGWIVSILSHEDPDEARPGSSGRDVTIVKRCRNPICPGRQEITVAGENMTALAHERGTDEAAAVHFARVQPPSRCPLCRAKEGR